MMYGVARMLLLVNLQPSSEVSALLVTQAQSLEATLDNLKSGVKYMTTWSESSGYSALNNQVFL